MEITPSCSISYINDIGVPGSNIWMKYFGHSLDFSFEWRQVFFNHTENVPIVYSTSPDIY